MDRLRWPRALLGAVLGAMVGFAIMAFEVPALVWGPDACHDYGEALGAAIIGGGVLVGFVLGLQRPRAPEARAGDGGPHN